MGGGRYRGLKGRGNSIKMIFDSVRYYFNKEFTLVDNDNEWFRLT